MIKIPLTKRKFKGQFALVDDCDQHLAKYNWHTISGYPCTTIDFKNRKYWRVFLHHAIIGYPLKGDVDHRNLDRKDARRENLRIISHRENCQNIPSKRKNGFVGIYKRGKKWRAQMQIRGKHKTLGTYDTPEAAQQAYLEKCKQLEGVN